MTLYLLKQRKMQLKSLKDTKYFSRNISKIIKPGDVIFLYGEIGVGKTTFVRFLINHLESKNKIKNSDILSPTFNIVYDYDVGKVKIIHYDLLRLKNYKDIFIAIYMIPFSAIRICIKDNSIFSYLLLGAKKFLWL